LLESIAPGIELLFLPAPAYAHPNFRFDAIAALDDEYDDDWDYGGRLLLELRQENPPSNGISLPIQGGPLHLILTCHSMMAAISQFNRYSTPPTEMIHAHHELQQQIRKLGGPTTSFTKVLTSQVLLHANKLGRVCEAINQINSQRYIGYSVQLIPQLPNWVCAHNFATPQSMVIMAIYGLKSATPSHEYFYLKLKGSWALVRRPRTQFRLQISQIICPRDRPCNICDDWNRKTGVLDYAADEQGDRTASVLRMRSQRSFA
jgi:hypothetical protein